MSFSPVVLHATKQRVTRCSLLETNLKFAGCNQESFVTCYMFCQRMLQLRAFYKSYSPYHDLLHAHVHVLPYIGVRVWGVRFFYSLLHRRKTPLNP